MDLAATHFSRDSKKLYTPLSSRVQELHDNMLSLFDEMISVYKNVEADLNRIRKVMYSSFSHFLFSSEK